MYNIEDKASAIKAIQRMLNINESGVYDQRTIDAVTKIQVFYNINSLGIVDYPTFEAIKEEYHKKQRERMAEVRLGVDGFPYSEGDKGESIELINYNIRDAISSYTYEGLSPRGAFYSQTTATAVRRMREIYMLEDSSLVDQELYFRIVSDILAK